MRTALKTSMWRWRVRTCPHKTLSSSRRGRMRDGYGSTLTVTMMALQMLTCLRRIEASFIECLLPQCVHPFTSIHGFPFNGFRVKAGDCAGALTDAIFSLYSVTYIILCGLC